MYCEHFGIDRFPFSLTPDLRFFQADNGADALFRQIINLINTDADLIEVIAGPGMGKTMLCRKLVKALRCHRSRYLPVFMSHPWLGKKQLLLDLLMELNPNCAEPISAEAIFQCIRQELDLAFEKHIVVVIDESQTLSRSMAELLLQLLTSPAGGSKLQLILYGQEHIAEKVTPGTIDVLAERDCHTLALSNIDRNQLGSYVVGRLRRAGYSGAEIVDPAALDVLHLSSQGVPRLINILMHKALINAWHCGMNRVTRDHIDLAIEETGAVP